MDDWAQGRNIDMPQGIHEVLDGMVAEGIEESIVSDCILHILVLVGHITDKDDNLATKIFSFWTLFEILFGVVEDKQECFCDNFIAFQNFLGEVYVDMENGVETFEYVEQDVYFEIWDVFFFQDVALLVLILFLKEKLDQRKHKKLNSTLEVETHFSAEVVHNRSTVNGSTKFPG